MWRVVCLDEKLLNEVDTIHVSQKGQPLFKSHICLRLICKFGKFLCSSRGYLILKSKGSVHTSHELCEVMTGSTVVVTFEPAGPGSPLPTWRCPFSVRSLKSAHIVNRVPDADQVKVANWGQNWLKEIFSTKRWMPEQQVCSTTRPESPWTQEMKDQVGQKDDTEMNQDDTAVRARRHLGEVPRSLPLMDLPLPHDVFADFTPAQVWNRRGVLQRARGLHFIRRGTVVERNVVILLVKRRFEVAGKAR